MSVAVEPVSKEVIPLVSLLMSGGLGPEPALIPQSARVALGELHVLDASSLAPGLGNESVGSGSLAFWLGTLPNEPLKPGAPHAPRQLWFLPPMPFGGLWWIAREAIEHS